ncbi:Bug family tripartite tricarboxylate transporter substrate binding protein [Ramlibacter sp.]|uniref:Bug family tripartite tricarboxylate transporter substrate binding protein n=1 Tax=Ramlibacter sp. TaxID=1917967 RepID=UPI003D119458
MRLSTFLRPLLASLIAVGSVFPAAAQDFPTRPVTLVIPFAPGGTAELIGRAVGKSMERHLGTTVVVDLRAGAGGNIGAAHVAQTAAADGYTILLGSASLASNASLMKLTFDPRKDLQPVAGICIVPNILLVSANSPYKTLPDLLAEARRNPDKLTFGSSGPGTSSHLAGELLKAATGTRLVHVPYKGSGLVYQDLIPQRVDMLFDLQGSALANIKGGLVRPLVTTAARRSSSLPDVPTVAESGFPGFENGSWIGFMVRTGTPPDIAAKIERATILALQDPAIRERFATIGAEPIPAPSAEFGKYVLGEMDRWEKMVKEGRLQRAQ